MSKRIEAKFAALAKEKRTALITYVMAGDPNIKASAQIIPKIISAGADLVEIGIPFSDPMADGPTIQAAGLRSLKAKTKLKDILALVKTLRTKDDTTPFILMGYYNPIYHYGVEKFCKDAVSAGVDGIILVDLPPEEENEFVKVASPHGLKLIRLIAPTTDDKRLAQLSRHAGGFLYYISIAGITGTKSADAKLLKTRVNHLSSKGMLPIAVGFGIKTPKQAAEVAVFSDAVVVGSALVEILANESFAVAEKFVKSLRSAIDKA